jgi:uncharacterized membrane protein
MRRSPPEHGRPPVLRPVMAASQAMAAIGGAVAGAAVDEPSGEVVAQEEGAVVGCSRGGTAAA